jgi:ABC-2 type transport system permease protein
MSAIADPVYDAVDFESLGKPIVGPRALTDDYERFWHLTFNMAKIAWQTRFFGSFLGYLWQIVRPLMLFATLYVFFVDVAHVNGNGYRGDGDFGTQLLAAIVLFNFFSEATSRSVRSVIDNENLVRKIQFPRMAIPLSMVMVASFNLALNLVVVAIFGALAGITPHASWVELPLILAALIAFAAGVAMLLSSLFVYFRDIDPMWEVFNQAFFYASPVIISVPHVLHSLGVHTTRIYMLNPMALIVQQFRHAMINSATPSFGQIFGSPAWLLIPLGIIAATFAAGFYVFNRVAPRVAENL